MGAAIIAAQNRERKKRGQLIHIHTQVSQAERKNEINIPPRDVKNQPSLPACGVSSAGAGSKIHYYQQEEGARIHKINKKYFRPRFFVDALLCVPRNS